MTIEELDNVLAHPNIQLAPITKKPGEFNRDRIFTLNGKEYHIEWWVNISYLYIGNVVVPFHRVRRANTWPIMSKRNLQFYDVHDQVCCVIPDLERYPVANNYAEACDLADAAAKENQ